ncbi:hypothetical protein AB0C27_20805 [Nonomuraea sp. NPDC048882]|uniref:hypothetical protein n=1 Tax=Nonomuraea sp. NPDC048882 TaxID=3154347 RepID=UPI0033DCEF14
MTESNPRRRLAGVLLLTSLVAMVAGAALVVPSGLTLNPYDSSAVLVAVRGHVGLHLGELAFDVVGWLGLAAAGLVLAGVAQVELVSGVRAARAWRSCLGWLGGGLLAGAGLAGVLHDAGNLAVTQLAGRPAAPAVGTVAMAVLLVAKWMVNLAGLLWVAATFAGAAGLPMPGWQRVAGVVAAFSGLAAVVLPWTTGTEGPTAGLEQLGYALHLPVMVWYAVLGGRYVR